MRGTPQRESAAGPSVRASYMKEVFRALEERGHLGVVEEHDPELRREVEAASRLSTLPIALNVRLVEAMCSAFGEERGLDILADCVYAQFESPLWKNFIEGAIRLLGRNPGSLGRWIPHAMMLVFRGCGNFTAESSSPGRLTVKVEALPERLANHSRWLRSLAIGMKPLFLLCGTDGVSELAEVDVELRRAVYVLTWKADA